MKKFFVLCILFSSMLFGAYDIKIGVFQNGKNLRANIAKVKPSTFRKQIIVQKKNNLYYAHAVIFGTGINAANALKAYRKVFKDAFISGKVREVKTKPKVKIIPKNISVKKEQKLLPVPKVKKELLDAKTLLLDKNVYVCYVNGPGHLDDRVVQMVFNEKSMVYSPLDKKVSLNIKYKIKKDKVFLNVMDTEIIHKLVDHKEGYITVESYIGMKKMHDLRYFFNQEDAFQYLKK
jgi:hypothetical protein